MGYTVHGLLRTVKFRFGRWAITMHQNELHRPDGARTVKNTVRERWNERYPDGEKYGGVWYFVPNGELISIQGNRLHRSEGLQTVKNGAVCSRICICDNQLHRPNGENMVSFVRYNGNGEVSGNHVPISNNNVHWFESRFLRGNSPSELNAIFLQGYIIEWIVRMRRMHFITT